MRIDIDVVNWLVTTNSFKLSKLPQTSGSRSEVLRCSIASFHAAVLLAIPTQLLNWSLSFFLAGIAIYYGEVFSNQLGTLPGPNSNLAVFLFYMITTAIAGLGYFLPLWGEALERREAEKIRDQNVIHVPLENISIPTGSVELLRALQSSLSAQELSLKTMQELVKAVTNQERNGSDAHEA
ncbi:MAG: hypothetical protein GOMPHAMPRED_007355 [Gomphillus americanus]|uniref:Uncharacterized protein n=1 Tax=Gomphillus americanus TaxID=1940652 RepID=A0A8H3ETQ2_9LECA|nr:MAG: hypothetical protein GOMPHAMPRED_007355 [Gomphillus americanus]